MPRIPLAALGLLTLAACVDGFQQHVHAPARYSEGFQRSGTFEGFQRSARVFCTGTEKNTIERPVEPRFLGSRRLYRIFKAPKQDLSVYRAKNDYSFRETIPDYSPDPLGETTFDSSRIFTWDWVHIKLYFNSLDGQLGVVLFLGGISLLNGLFISLRFYGGE